MRHIAERELQLPDAVIGKLLGLAAEDKSILSLGPGEPDFETPKPLLNYLKSIISKNKELKYSHYSPSEGRTDLRKAITKKLKKENKINADIDEILVTCGSQEGIFTTLLSTLDINEQVIIPNPGYLAYLPAIELSDAVPVDLELKEEENFEINPDRIKKLINKKTRSLMVNTPSNPTGTVLNKKLLEEIADIAVDNDLYVLSDEAYEKLIYDSKHISIGSLNGMKNYVITLQSFSKSYAMCGFRLGYVHGPKNVIQAMTKSIHYITLTAPHISQLMAMKALTLPNKHIEKMRKEYDRRRKFIVKRLNEIGLKTLEPKGAFYTFSNIKDFKMSSSKFANKLLKEAKVAVVPGTEFGRFGEGYIRCSYATDYKIIVKAMNRLEKFVKKL
ncbi:MAG: pyridoxal phosphate-dependent aminotransferase [Candidatus Nanoarchaeia archaeon]|jgi:aminotransferase|nr:pyridoxal phosphate-dependent aminotransferase [Candidatus Nanoarchaeia archaeon]|tara:strand:+ start:11757 stop:12920 length:1164 start_codon:yes stop_codon:yes gene_type:complete